MLDMIKSKQPIFYQQAFVPISKNIVSHAYFIEINDVVLFLILSHFVV